MNSPLFSTGTDDWETPGPFFAQYDAEFHFTVDVCATSENAKCRRFYSPEMDGMAQDWSGETVWCNPPYSVGKQEKWVRKCWEEGQKPGTIVVTLLPARTDTKRFHEYILGKAELRFVPGRIKFSNAKWNAPFPCMIAIWRGPPKIPDERPRTVLKYPGAKWSIADWIISVMPPHKSYLEPFFGSGAVFFRKPPSRIETVNDLDGEIVNLFACIRDRPGELERAVALTTYSREEYERAWAVLGAGHMGELDPVERARLTLVRYWQTHGSNTIYKSGWKNDVAGREYAYAAQYWARLPAWVSGSVERLKAAQIECLPAVEVIRRFRSPDVLIYADPPYVLSTRKGPQYRVELEDGDHVELLKVLREHPGPVMLSGYDNELYRDMLDGWDKLQRPVQCEKGGRRMETLWVNYQVQTTIGGVSF